MRNTAQEECIKLSFPVNAAYVSSARLTASSIANRMGFDIDEIEDIKTAVSEACTYIISTLTATINSNFEISFRLTGDTLQIGILTQGAAVSQDADEMSLVMIKALVDEFNIDDVRDAGKESIALTMIKKHKDSIFI